MMQRHPTISSRRPSLRQALAILAAAAAFIVAIHSSSFAAAAGDADFHSKAEKFIGDELRRSPEFATQAGDHRYDHRLTDLSQRGIADAIKRLRRWRRDFAALDPDALSVEEEADREWLVARIDGRLLDYEELKLWRKDPGLYLPTAAIYGLLKRDFAPLTDRMRSITAREKAALANLHAARANLVPSAAPSQWVDIVLEQMPATIRFFVEGVPHALESVEDEEARAAFNDGNGRLVDALKDYEAWLRRLRPRASGRFALGEHAFVRMLATRHMVDTPLDELEQRGQEELADLQDRFRATAVRIDPMQSPEEVYAELAAKHPAEDQVIAEVSSRLEGIRAFVIDHRLATIPSEVRPMVRETPPYRRATTFASMDVPGPFEKTTEAYYYVTLPDPEWPPEKKEQRLQFFSPPSISDTSVHEVYPGHYVHFLHVLRNPDPVRQLFRSSSTSEGWGLYCEQMMIDAGLHGDSPEFRLAQLQMALVRACRYLVAIRLHSRSMTFDQAIAFFERNAFMTHVNARSEALRGTQDPDYLEYQLGKLMILKLRSDVQRRDGDSFDLGRFHDSFMDQGAPPMKLIRRAMLGEEGPLL